jgi:cytoskeletal protein RodZ
MFFLSQSWFWIIIILILVGVMAWWMRNVLFKSGMSSSASTDVQDSVSEGSKSIDEVNDVSNEDELKASVEESVTETVDTVEEVTEKVVDDAKAEVGESATKAVDMTEEVTEKVSANVDVQTKETVEENSDSGVVDTIAKGVASAGVVIVAISLASSDADNA